MKCVKKKFGKDLEIIDDGNYVYLRRRSSCLIPIFCIFGITEEYLRVNKTDEHNVYFEMEFPNAMYEGFSNKSENSVAFVQAETFKKDIDTTLKELNLPYFMEKIRYDIVDKEFYIEPTNERKELFLKRSVYAEQNEIRIILPTVSFKNICERKSIMLSNKKDRYILKGKIRLSFIGKR